jgi:hypothetical protein
MVPNYTVKPPVTQVYNRRITRLSDAPSSPSVEPSSPDVSSLEQLLRRSHRLH